LEVDCGNDAFAKRLTEADRLPIAATAPECETEKLFRQNFNTLNALGSAQAGSDQAGQSEARQPKGQPHPKQDLNSPPDFIESCEREQEPHSGVRDHGLPETDTARINPGAYEIPARKRKGLVQKEPDRVPWLPSTHVSSIRSQNTCKKSCREVARRNEEDRPGRVGYPWVPLDRSALLQEQGRPK
jgi:hypothetical protein